MKHKLRTYTKALFPKRLVDFISFTPDKPFQRISYAQEGEDLILEKLIGNRAKGFYIDIGAHHPFRLSNTYKFYLKGWRGINIDPMPGSMELFESYRPHDINLEVGISDNEKELEYFILSKSALNTFSEEEAMFKNGLGIEIVERKFINTKRLDSVLRQYLSKGQIIDFMSIDTEGFEQQVLNSNNWDEYRPYIVLVEQLRCTLSNVVDRDAYKFMIDMNYELISKTQNTLFFMDKSAFLQQ